MKPTCRTLFILLLLTIMLSACSAATSQPTPQPVMTASPTATPFPREISDNGVKMVLIPAGTFWMGNDDSFFDQRPGHDVNLPDFYMDVYEITNAHYNACVAAGKCQLPKNLSSFSRSDYYTNPKYADYPVIYVDWAMAQKYCEWRGPLSKTGETRLPSEAEWEKAARGTDGRRYPWGEHVQTNAYANYNYQDTSVAGDYEAGKSPYGIYDMAGNVREWTSDWYDIYLGGDTTKSKIYGQTYRVIRGGGWDSGGDNELFSYMRMWKKPSETNYATGFRCARSITGAHLLPVAPTRTTTRSPTPSITPTRILTATPTPTFSYSAIINDKRGAKMVLIPAGTFTMGSDKGPANEKPIHRVELPDFYMDLYIVSNGRYRVCVLAGKCPPPTSFSSYNDPDYYRNPHYDESAVLYVNWEMAKAYCDWRGARLPTEAEWEKAERGMDGNTYIWGEGAMPGNNRNLLSPLGIYEMTGSAWQWMEDWYVDYDLQADKTVFNPQGPASGEYRVLRGGYFVGTRTTERTMNNPAFSNFDIGFRCARSSP